MRPPTQIEDPARRQRIAIAVALILLVSAALRLWQVGTPNEYMFDEVYYAKDAKAVVDGRVGTHGQLRWEAGDEVSWPHPEMGKFAIATGILLFGDRGFGWRLPAVIAGLVILACIYPLARRLGLPPPWALLALVFAAADPLGIAQSRIATLDVFLGAWTVLCVLLALRYVQDGRRTRWLLLCGLVGGLALTTKWSGVLALVAALGIVLLANLLDQRDKDDGLKTWLIATAVVIVGVVLFSVAGVWLIKESASLTVFAVLTAALVCALVVWLALRRFIRPDPDEWSGDGTYLGQRLLGAVDADLMAVAALVLLPAAMYLLSYGQYFIAGHTWADWLELQRQMLTFNQNLHATHTYASKAWTWILDYRPVWYYFKGKTEYRGLIGIGNPFLWWSATLALVATPVVLAVALVAPGTRAALRTATQLLPPPAGLVVLLWVPWFLTSRTSFMYYMTPVAPFMAILVAAALAVLAGRPDLPRRSWPVVAIAAAATGLPWAFASILPRHGGPLGTVGICLAVLLLVPLGVIVSQAPRKDRLALVVCILAGIIAGIAVAFLPIVLQLPITPRYFELVTWFKSWI